MDKRVIDYPEAYELEEDDYLILESVNGGTCKILAKPLEPIHLVVTSIEAVYVQSGVVKDNDSLDILRPDLTVTAYYNDGSSEVVTEYDLSGTLEVGTSTITASYKGFSDTFDVTVETSITYLYKWDFTQSLTDEVQGVTATLTNATFTQGVGIIFDARNDNVNFGNVISVGQTLELDVGDFVAPLNANYNAWFVVSGAGGFSHRAGTGDQYWQVLKLNDTWATYTLSSTDNTIFANKTVKFVFVDSNNLEVYVNDVLMYSGGTFVERNNQLLYLGDSPSVNKSINNMTITGVRIYANQ